MDILELDLSAAIIAATGHYPQLSSPLEGGKMAFIFPDDELTRAAIAGYVTGTLTLNAKQLLRARTDLYAQMRRGRR